MSPLLPIGVESYLQEAGFTPTEILVLKKLVEEDALTLRELALKTGKSTGVLDQATKKLLAKGIVRREVINEQPRYSIHSLDAIVRWVDKDMHERREILERRHHNFESFIASLKKDRRRPDMEYFEGEEGMEKAYMKLLTPGLKELLHYRPVACREEEDPLRAFQVRYFRERHRRSIFARGLAPNTPLGRRFRSRDPFEYRETQLLEEEEAPITFEKIIAGDIVACFNHAEGRACFIHYPELAKTERTMFALLWRRAKEAEGSPALSPADRGTPAPLIPLSTRTLSSFREFMLSKKSIAAFAIFALIAGAITFGLYRNAREYNLQRIRDKAISIAATGALQFDPKDIEAVRTPADIHKAEYAKLIATLNLIRRNNEGIRWAYIWRETKDPTKLAFVADADSLNPYEKKDLNGDGKIDEADVLTAPGDLYDISQYMSTREAFERPTADPEPVTDQWGTVLAAAAPIKNERGETVALFGVDTAAARIDVLTAQSFSPLFVFLGFFFLFVFIRLAAFNRSLFLELVKFLRLKRVFYILGVCAVAALGVTYGMYRHNLNLNIERARDKAVAIAVTAAPELNAEDIEQIHSWRDMEKDVYKKLVLKLRDIRNRNENVRSVYIERETGIPYEYENVADADALDIRTWNDLNNDGLRNDLIFPGYLYYWDVSDYPDPKPSWRVDESWGSAKPYTDFTGMTWITGTAPILDKDGRAVAEVGIDIDLRDIYSLAHQTFSPFFVFFGCFLLFILIRLAAFNRSPLRIIGDILGRRKPASSLTTR